MNKHIRFAHSFVEMNIKVIQEIMGQANISITMEIYAKANTFLRNSLEFLRFRVFHAERIDGNRLHHLIF